MPTTYRLSILLSGEKNLSTVISTLEGVGRIESVELVQVDTTRDARSGRIVAPHERNTPRKNDGARLKGRDLVLEIMTEPRIYTYKEIAESFAAAGFKPASAGPRLSECMKTGKVKFLGEGKYCIPGTVIKL